MVSSANRDATSGFSFQLLAVTVYWRDSGGQARGCWSHPSYLSYRAGSAPIVHREYISPLDQNGGSGFRYSSLAFCLCAVCKFWASNPSTKQNSSLQSHGKKYFIFRFLSAGLLCTVKKWSPITTINHSIVENNLTIIFLYSYHIWPFFCRQSFSLFCWCLFSSAAVSPQEGNQSFADTEQYPLRTSW